MKKANFENDHNVGTLTKTTGRDTFIQETNKMALC